MTYPSHRPAVTKYTPSEGEPTVDKTDPAWRLKEWNSGG